MLTIKEAARIKECIAMAENEGVLDGEGVERSSLESAIDRVTGDSDLTELSTLRAMRDALDRAAAENTQVGDPTELARRVIDENNNGPIAYALAKQVIRDHQHTLLLMARATQTASAERTVCVERIANLQARVAELEGVAEPQLDPTPDRVEHPPSSTLADPPRISCHPGHRCSGWPECKYCGPARI